MIRLTKTYADGTHGVADNLPCGENSYAFKDLLIHTLGEYEDLGITPDQVRQMDAEFTRASKELADYKKSVDQGRLLHLPCKAGDTVYLEAEYENEITEGRVWKKEF